MKNIKLFLLINILVFGVLMPSMAQNTREYVIDSVGNVFSLKNIKKIEIFFDSTVTAELSNQQIAEILHNDSLVISSESLKGNNTFLYYYPINSVTKIYYNEGVVTQKNYEEELTPIFQWRLLLSFILSLLLLIVMTIFLKKDILVNYELVAFIGTYICSLLLHFIPTELNQQFIFKETKLTIVIMVITFTIDVVNIGKFLNSRSIYNYIIYIINQFLFIGYIFWLLS